MIPAVFVVTAVGIWLIASNIRLRLRVNKLEKENNELSILADAAASRYLNAP